LFHDTLKKRFLHWGLDPRSIETASQRVR